jgi:hypothetical protein
MTSRVLRIPYIYIYLVQRYGTQRYVCYVYLPVHLKLPPVAQAFLGIPRRQKLLRVT